MAEEANSDAASDQLSVEEKKFLLHIARSALEVGIRGDPIPKLELTALPPKLIRPGATFITLTKKQELRGCIGSLEATRPLAEDVQVHAVAAALEDFRFPPVQEAEIPRISIEISRLTTPEKITFEDPEELISQIRPGIDGVVIKKGIRRATFLPQVWEKVPEVEIFLEMLCRKMGASAECWRSKSVEIYTYKVEKFCE